jgi:iron complex outermembrane receptor protein
MQMQLKHFTGFAALTLILVLTNSANVLAQEVTKKTNSKLSVDEIVVTARKRQESLQEVPLSITAFTADQLEQLGAFDNEDVALLTPNFNTVTRIGRTSDLPTIRGQSAPVQGVAPNASYFIDGVYVSGSIKTMTLGPIERVEILRGPQSAQFGRSTFSGAINYITKRPTNEFSGQLKSSVASHDSATVSGWASGPLVQDRLLYFVGASWDTYGGEYRNELKDFQAPIHLAAPLTAPQRGDNSRLGGTETKDINLTLTWTPSDSSQLTFKSSYNEGDDEHYVSQLQELGELNCYLPTVGNPGTADNSSETWFTTSGGDFCGTFDPKRVNYNPQNPFNPSNPSFGVSAYPSPEAYEPGWAFPRPAPGTPVGIANTLPAQGAPRQTRLNLPDFYDGIMGNPGCLGGITPADCIAAPAKPGTRRKTKRLFLEFTQDVWGNWRSISRIAYNKDDFEAAYDLDRTERRPLLGTGLFHMLDMSTREDRSFESRIESTSDTPLRGSLGVNYIKLDRKTFQRQFPGPGLGQFPARPFDENTENVAVFGSMEYDLTDQWRLSTEVRWAKEDRDITSGVACEDVGDPFEGLENIGKITTKSLTPRFTVSYQPTDTANYYALLAKGEKPAEFINAYYRSTADQCETLAVDAAGGANTVKPEKAWTYEVGTKQTWLDRRITANLSLFFIDWENQAVIRNTLVGGMLTSIITNAGASEVWGAELETNFIFTENLSGQFSYGLANGTFTNFNDEQLARTTGVGLKLLPNGKPERDARGDPVYDESANNAKGLRIPGSPKHTFIFGLNYTNEVTLNLLDGADTLDWFARTNFVLETGRYDSPDNHLKFPNRKLWSGRVGLESTSWTFTTYVNNILDDLTPLGISRFPIITGPTWANGYTLTGPAPFEGIPNGQGGAGGPTQYSTFPAFGRAYGLELVYRFGD